MGSQSVVITHMPSVATFSLLLKHSTGCPWQQ